MSNDIFGTFKELLKESAKVLEQNTNLDFGLTNKNSNSSVVQNNNIVVSNVNLSDEYVERNVIFGKVKFKQANPTFVWDSHDNYGSDLDTVFFYSEGGKEIDPEVYHEIKSYIEFTYDVDNKPDNELREQYKRYYGITNLDIERIDKRCFKKHVKAEDSNVYFESYMLTYPRIKSDGTTLELTYSIQLILYKNEYSLEELNRMASEYHGIIDTFEIVSIGD